MAIVTKVDNSLVPPAYTIQVPGAPLIALCNST